ncbi:MAG: hypothetical protein O7A06_03530 [Acidobacteria bacterium]|nr:hypothetical protein [Acidobacteriota bacterium]
MSESSLPADGLEQLLQLEEKINQTSSILQAAKAESAELARENSRLQATFDEQNKTIRLLEGRLHRLEKQRETVRGRVQKLRNQLDSLTNE